MKFMYPDWLTCKKDFWVAMARHITHITVTIAYEILTISITKINVVDNSYIKLRTCKYNISQWQENSLPCQ